MSSNSQALQGQWTQFRSAVKSRWSELTEEDLQLLEGKLEQLVGRIQVKSGEAKEAIESFFVGLLARGTSAVTHGAETVGQFAHKVGDRVTADYERAEDTVRHNPAASVAAVFGIGLVTGLIVGLIVRRD